MTSESYFEITFWEGLLPTPPIKEDIVDAVGTTFHSSMAELPTQTFFTELSKCKTTGHLYAIIYLHQRMHQRPPSLPHALRYPYFNPTEYRITEVVILKQRVFIQHEGFVFRIHHEPPAHHSPEPDFLITINRSIESTRSNSIFSSPKLAIDRAACILSPVAAQIEGTFSQPVVWRMPAPGQTFNLNLCQLGVLLHAVPFSFPQQQYHALYKNCFSHSRILRAVLIRAIQAQQTADSGQNVVAAHEPDTFGMRLGTCFGFSLDKDEGEDLVVYLNYQILYNELLA